MGGKESISRLCHSHVSPFDCWFRFIRKTSGVPSCLRDLDELYPRRMVPEDVADHELSARAPAQSPRRARRSSTVSASGFSTNTCAPASIALIA